MASDEQQPPPPPEEGSHSTRPRRPDTETLTYLRSLEPLIDKSVGLLLQQQQQQRRPGTPHDVEGPDGDEAEEEAEERRLLVSNLIDELTFKVASLAMDRHAAPVLEKLARLCTRKQLACLFEGCLGYAASLASNRYSSHVMQTFLSLAGPMIEAELQGGMEEEDSDDEEGAEATPASAAVDGDGEQTPKGPVSLCASATKLVQELQVSWVDLIYDLCGTHSMRALFSLLTGMPVVAERRGRNAKHQHAIETAVFASPTGMGGGVDNLHATQLPMRQVPEEFGVVLEAMVAELGQMQLMTLHQTLCDANASPALCLLLQAVARREGPETLALAPDGVFLTQVVHKALCWTNPERCAETVYAMAGEALSSRFLEAVLWHTDPATVAARLFETCFQGRVLEFAEDDVANFVLQTWLQRTSSSKHLKAALEELSPHFRALVQQKRRTGVLWRLAGACLRLHKQEKKMVKALLEGLGGEEEEEKKRNGKAAAGHVVRTMLSLQVGREEENGGRLFLNVPGARLLECLMAFPSEKEGSGGRVFCQAILDLPAASLVAVAKDNVGSRTLLDPLLLLSSSSSSAAEEGGGGGGGGWADALTKKFKGHCAELALHPVGFHVLTKTYAAGGLSLEGKRMMVEELLTAEPRLAGGSFGRRALNVLSTSLYRGNRGKWEELQRKGEKKRQVLDDLFEILEEEGGKKKEKEEKEAAEVLRSKPSKKDKKGKKKEESDGIMAMLMGKGGEEKEVGKHKAKASDKPADLGFVLEAIKKSGGGEATAPAASAGGSERKPRKEGGKKGTRNEERATPRQGNGVGERKKRPRQHEETAATATTPVEKAKQLLGTRAMMTKNELFSAVEGLEREIKGKKKSKA